jgi:hypothetical protein
MCRGGIEITTACIPEEKRSVSHVFRRKREQSDTCREGREVCQPFVEEEQRSIGMCFQREEKKR